MDITHRRFTVRPLEMSGYFITNHRRYFEYSEHALSELRGVTMELQAKWPGDLRITLKDDAVTPELQQLGRRRDRLSDSTRIFAAMSVEAFLNFYGVMRLGEKDFQRTLERLSLIQKLRTLLLLCDGVSVEDNDPVVACAKRLATQRNDLVHPKATETQGYVPAEQRLTDEIPALAEQCVTDARTFFASFVALVPGAAHVVSTVNSRGDP